MTQIDYGLDITRVVLAVSNLDKVSAFYKRTVGLNVLHQDGSHAVLGAGDVALLELQHDPHATRQPQAPGLFHTAFLLPKRGDLASWLDMAAKHNVYADGASNHPVSEAVYLTDPEGNGVEIYADKPQTAWAGPGGAQNTGRRGIDFDGLMKLATHWGGAPVGTKIGHVHLQVGDVEEATRVFVDGMGIDLVKKMGGSRFYSAGGYHHHFAANAHLSRYRGAPTTPATGLRRVDVEIDTPAALPETIEAPWGTTFGLSRRAALAA
mgnify:CR=1 FL=1